MKNPCVSAPSCLLVFLSVAALSACSASDLGEPDVAENQAELNVLESVLWPSPHISVCFENPTGDNEGDRNAVREAVEYWWNYRAGFDFHGFGPCGSEGADLRVQISDDSATPHAKGLGKQLQNVRNGIVLMYRYANHWRTECRGTSSKHYDCQREYAVHEFGHALGFSHEHGRDDTPDSCRDKETGSSFTKYGPYDPESVMGYCSDTRLGGGRLSGFDIFYSMYAYGIDHGRAYFFQHWHNGRTGNNTGWYAGSGCQNVFSHHNDTYSYVMLGRGVKGVRVWEHTSCRGASRELTSSDRLADWWNDRVSSIEILY